MSDERKKRSWAWVGWLLAIMMLYPASAGPVTLLFERAHINDAWLAIPYGPIKLAMDNNETFKRLFLAYLRFWVKI
jgi:hypothetical protein